MTQSDSHRPERAIRRASYLLMVTILISRLIGFIREWTLAKTIGASTLTDIYYASFTLPDFLNYLMATGAVSISLIPILNDFLARKDEQTPKIIFRFLATYLVLGITSLVILGEIFAPWISYWVAPGFDATAKETLTSLIRIILPAQIFFLWGALAISVQHTHGKFFIPSIAPIFYNFFIIFFGLLLHQQYSIYGFSIGVTVGCFLSHGVLQYFGLKKLGYSVTPYFQWNELTRAQFKKYFSLTLPVMLGLSIVVTEEWITKWVGSQLSPKSISYVSYARMELRIPIALIGQAAGIASFPFLSRLFKEGKIEVFSELLGRETTRLFLLSGIGFLIFYFYAYPLTFLIYGSGKLTPEDIALTSQCLKAFTLGLFFWILQNLVSRIFYVFEKNWVPTLVGTVLTFASIPLYQFLAFELGAEGLSLTSSLLLGTYILVLIATLIPILKQKRIKIPRYFLKIWSVFVIIFGGLGVALWFLASRQIKIFSPEWFDFFTTNSFRQLQLAYFIELLTVSFFVTALIYFLQKFILKRFQRPSVF